MAEVMYVGKRGPGGCDVAKLRYLDGGKTRRSRLRHVVRHSPTGLEWGYGGSGPADLALSLCVDALGKELAEELYQEFKWRVVVHLPWNGWRLSRSYIQEWAAQQKRTKETEGTERGAAV